jgi:cohesin complex subunit SCC1
LIVDGVKAISGDDLKSQLLDTEDILIPLDLAPPTKKLMVMKEVGATDKLFSLPGNNLNSITKLLFSKIILFGLLS